MLVEVTTTGVTEATVGNVSGSSSQAATRSTTRTIAAASRNMAFSLAGAGAKKCWPGVAEPELFRARLLSRVSHALGFGHAVTNL